MTPVVVDVAAAVALLLDAGPAGEWVAVRITGRHLAAAELVMDETANVLRRHVAASALSPAEASLAHEDLRALALELWPYAAVAERVWQLRDDVTVHDPVYVAGAELLGAEPVTLDARPARAPGVRCPVLVSQL